MKQGRWLFLWLVIVNVQMSFSDGYVSTLDTFLTFISIQQYFDDWNNQFSQASKDEVKEEVSRGYRSRIGESALKGLSASILAAAIVRIGNWVASGNAKLNKKRQEKEKRLIAAAVLTAASLGLITQYRWSYAFKNLSS